jgi:hypothetical protein
MLGEIADNARWHSIAGNVARIDIGLTRRFYETITHLP